MRRFNLLLPSLGILSFAATLGVLHVTRGPLFGNARENALATAVFPIAQIRHDDEPFAAAVALIPAVAPPGATAVVQPPAAYTAPAGLPEPARAELVTLRATLENEADVRGRLVAINALRRMGMGGDADGYVRASLRVAMNDPNPNVKSNAEQAYEMVAAQYGGQ